MKHSLFLVFFLFGAYCIAQNNRPKSHDRISALSPVFKNMNPGADLRLKSVRPNNGIYEKMTAKHYTKLRSQNQLLDSVYMWLWDTTNADWVLDYKYSVTEYDANNNVLTESGMYWDGSIWVNSDITYYTYDGKNNELGYEWLYWSGTGWENDQKGSYEYDINNNIVTQLVQDGDGNVWINSMLIKKTYDDNNNVTSYLHQNWNGTDWENYWQHIYTYDINNNMTSDLRQGWSGNQWENSWQNTYEYDNNNNLIHEINYVDNGAELVTSEKTIFYDSSNKLVRDSTHTSGNSWEYDVQGIYTYDLNANLVSLLFQSINGDLLENLARDLYTYDAANNQTSQFYQYWKDNTWVNSGLDTYKYDEYNFLTNSTLREWNTEGTMVTTGDSTVYYYHSLNTGINAIGRNSESLKVFPNPSCGIFNIQSTNNINSLEIYNSYGKLIRSESGFKQQTNSEIDLSNYCKGVYLLKIKLSTGIVSKKVLIQ